jgi:hypothetical protein
MMTAAAAHWCEHMRHDLLVLREQVLIAPLHLAARHVVREGRQAI